MAWIGEVSGGSNVNVSTIVGAEIRNVSRNGTSVYFEYRAYIYQNTSTWSSNTWALWVEGNQNNVKGTGASSQWTKYYSNWYGRSISLGTGSNYAEVSVGVNGTSSNSSSPKGYVTLPVYDLPTASPPSLSGLSVSGISDKSAYLSFGINSENNATVTDGYIDLSLTNFGTVVKTISSRAGTLSGLDPNRTYYARGNAANAAGRSYTGVISFKTGFVNPGSPGKPSLTYDQTEVIPRAKITAKWTAASAGSTAVAGYRIRLFKNNVEVFSIDTENTNLSYTFNSLESYGFAVGDKVKVGIYSYSKDWEGTKFFNGGGADSSQIYSNDLTVVSDKYIYASVNGAAFNKYKMYVSVNGGSFTEIKKEKFKIIK